MNKEQVFQQAREQVSNSYPSIFTKDDVIRLIIDLEKNMQEIVSETKSVGITKEKVQEILEKYTDGLKEAIEYNVETRDMWSDDNIQMSVSYREICIDDVEIDLDPVLDVISSECRNFDLDEYFEEEEEENEVLEIVEENDNDE
jgi:uncharacterized protein YneR